MKSADTQSARFSQTALAGAESAPDELADEPLEEPASALPALWAGLDVSLGFGLVDEVLAVDDPFLKSVTYQPEPLS